ncbi:MAG: SDR family oxidoreductase [Kastovskya adunca ATA6-11-RM4]|jgi:short-subunit dehydrogenase|nr:SDR family oxidoreductase [Kastovskya adunca ATA6-11-RM4]
MASTVLITGASQGIGKATALLFAKNGYDVVLAARNPETLDATAQEVRAFGQAVLAVPTDVSKLEAVQALVERTLAAFGHIDVLVNNAGICMQGPFEETSIEDWQQIIEVNLWAYIYTIKTLLPQFLAQGKGTIINVGSFGGKMPLPYMTPYCTTKYAVTGLTESLRLELEPKGIQVCGVHPGLTKSNFLERTKFIGKDDREVQERHNQMVQIQENAIASSPEDVAQAIWNMVKHPQAEVVVGAAAVPTLAHRLVPNVTQWMLQRSVKA